MNKFCSFGCTILLMLSLLVLPQVACAAERSEEDFSGAAYKGIVVNCHEWITLRYAPTADSPALAQIPLGTVVVVFDGSVEGIDGFYPVTYKNLKGYCMREYLKYYSDAGAPVRGR